MSLTNQKVKSNEEIIYSDSKRKRIDNEMKEFNDWCKEMNIIINEKKVISIAFFIPNFIIF